MSDEKGRKGDMLYSPSSLNIAFKQKFNKLKWVERRRDFFVSTDYQIVKQIEPLTYQEQKEFLESIKHPLYNSYNQTDFIKNKIGVEVHWASILLLHMIYLLSIYLFIMARLLTLALK